MLTIVTVSLGQQIVLTNTEILTGGKRLCTESQRAERVQFSKEPVSTSFFGDLLDSEQCSALKSVNSHHTLTHPVLKQQRLPDFGP